MNEELYDLHKILDAHFFVEFAHKRTKYRYCKCGQLEWYKEDKNEWKPSKYLDENKRVNSCVKYWSLCESAARAGIELERTAKPMTIVRRENKLKRQEARRALVLAK